MNIDRQLKEKILRWKTLKDELDRLERELTQQEEHRVTIYDGELRPIADKTVSIERNLITRKLEWPVVAFSNLPDCHVVFAQVDDDYPIPLRAEKAITSGDTLSLDLY